MKYTDKQVDLMSHLYKEATDATKRKAVVQRLAREFNTSSRSIIGKLVSLQLYVKSESGPKSESLSESKESYSTALRIMLGTKGLTSLDRMTKKDLVELQALLVALNDKFDLQ